MTKIIKDTLSGLLILLVAFSIIFGLVKSVECIIEHPKLIIVIVVISLSWWIGNSINKID